MPGMYPQREKAYRRLFRLDETPWWPGWTFGQYWNGWATPGFEYAEAVKVAAATGGRYDAKRDMFVTPYDTEDPDTGPDEEWPAEMIETTTGPRKLYRIGAYSWTWWDKVPQRGRASSRSNPIAPDKPLRTTIQNASLHGFFVWGWDGRRKVGALLVDLERPDRHEADAARAALGELPVWAVHNADLKPDWRAKGYGTQLYMTAAAEAVARSGGPIIFGAGTEVSYFGTSQSARAVWRRLAQEYPATESGLAIRVGPDDIQPWMRAPVRPRYFP